MKITDERLKVRNLKNLRIVFLVENLFLCGALGWQLIQGKGVFAVFDWGNVPFAAICIAGMTNAVLSPNVSEPMADKPRMATKRLVRIGLLVWGLAGVGFWLTIQAQPFGIRLALAVGCGLMIALVVTGIVAWQNHFRSKDDE